MAPKKSPAKKSPAKSGPTRAERKVTKAKKLGYGGDVAAMTSATKQYGLVKNEAGKYVRPNMEFLQRQMTANGWYGTIPGSSTTQTGTTPVNIGGMRWMVGPDGVKPTGIKANTGVLDEATGTYSGGKKYVVNARKKASSPKKGTRTKTASGTPSTLPGPKRQSAKRKAKKGRPRRRRSL